VAFKEGGKKKFMKAEQTWETRQLGRSRCVVILKWVLTGREKGVDLIYLAHHKDRL
jgi:hypothetical protein